MSSPEVPRKGSYKVSVKPGKYWWCACGKSSNQPFCDGSHKGTGLSPVMVEIDEEKMVSWCGCKHSENKPFCDSTHRSL